MTELRWAGKYLPDGKGREDLDVARKDEAASAWCERATKLTGIQWHYLKVLEVDYRKMQPADFEDVVEGLPNLFS